MSRLILVLSLSLAACIKVAVPYLPNPAAVADPRAEIEKVLNLNSGGELTTVEFKDGFFIVKSVGQGGVRQQTLRYETLGTMRLSEWGPYFHVAVSETSGDSMFEWTFKTLADAQRMLDSVSALSTPERPHRAVVGKEI